MSKPRHRFFRNKKKHNPLPRSQASFSTRHAPPATHHPKPLSKREAEIVEGIYQSKGKFGFVLAENPKLGDVMIQGPTARLAMSGDRVRARVTSGPEEARRSGEMTDVLVRSRETMVGAFRRMGNLPVLVPDDDGPMVHLTDLKSLVPHVGDIVTAKILTWPTGKDAATGALVEILGPRDAPGVDLRTLIRKYELPDAFPPEVAREADAYGHDVPDSTWQGRRTFFDRRVFTIDGADAKDFDDAVSLEPLPHGWRLGVHIADVAHYVKEGSGLDAEAYRRGTSVYLTGTVIPMLPFPLSDNLCSLRPDRVRLTLSCVMDIDKDGHVSATQVFESAIKSAKRFTYEEVEAILKGETPGNVTSEIVADVREMGVLARLLRAKRFGRGSLDFDFPEPEVVTGLDGRPLDIRKRGRLESHRLIEDFMLAANEAIARYMSSTPFLYRIHETPDPAKLQKLTATLGQLGLRIPRHINPEHPSALQTVIKASERTPLQPIVHLMVLRSLKQAVYSPANKGHYGLASECYTHFTSPIRRYPDLIVHRIVKERLHHALKSTHWKNALHGICTHTSRRERWAVDAEREYLDIQKVRLMEPRVGETFTGTVSSVTAFGFFVQLKEFFVEGLVHVTSLGNDYFIYDEARMTLKGRKSGRVFSMGQPVTIRLAAANILKHQLDFQLISADKAPTPAPSTPTKHHGQKHPSRSKSPQRRRQRRRAR